MIQESDYQSGRPDVATLLACHILFLFAVHPRSGSSHQEVGDGKGQRGEGVDEEEPADRVWSNYDPLDVVGSGGNDHVLDDGQRIRNVLPLVLIFQCLPAMTNSVQVCIACYCNASASCEACDGLLCGMLSWILP